MDGQVAIVTGGAQNIGEGIARTFSGAGAKVMIADLNGDQAVATAKAIAEETGNDVRGNRLQRDRGGRHRALRRRDRRGRSAASPRSSTTSAGAGPYDDPLAAITPDEMIESYQLNTISACG